MKQEFEVKRKVTREMNMRLQEDMGQCRYDMEIQRDHIQEMDQKYELLLEDFKN